MTNKIYTKNTWTDEVLTGAEAYQLKNDSGVVVYSQAQIALSTSVVTPGSAVNASRMNNLENGVNGLDNLVDFQQASSKVTPVDNDVLPGEDSASTYAHVKFLWSNIKATLKTYFDTLYVSIASFVAAIHAATSKTPPVAADEFPMLDSANSFGLVKVTYTNLLATIQSAIQTAFASVYAAIATPIKETSGPTTLTTGSIADGQRLKRSGSTLIGETPTGGVDIVIGDGVNVITTGVKGFIELPYAGTITQVSLVSDVSGSIVIDIWKQIYASFPPTVTQTIDASALPTLSSAQKYQDATLTGWTKTFAAGDWLAFNVNSAVTLHQVTLSIRWNKS